MRRYSTAAAFLTMMSSLVSRDPAVFLQAVARTCALETARGETVVRLKTAKEMQQQPVQHQQQQQQQQGSISAIVSRDALAAGTAAAEQQAATEHVSAAAAGPPQTPGAQRGAVAGGEAGAAPGGFATPAAAGRDSSTGGAVAGTDKTQLLKSASKSSRKLVPGSFVEVVDALLDVVLSYNGAPEVDKQQSGADQQQQQQQKEAATAAMELDAAAGMGAAAAAADPSAAPAPAPATAAGSSGADLPPLPADLLLRKLTPQSREVGIQAMVLRLLTDYCLLFNNSVGLLLKRDSECGPADVRVSGHHQHAAQPAPGHEARTPSRRSSSRAHGSSGGGSTAGAKGSTPGAPWQPSDPHRAGVVLKHIMRVQLVDQALPGTSPGSSVAANASALLQAVCIRSGEGRRRVINELVATLSTSSGSCMADSGSTNSCQQPMQLQLPYICKPGSPSPVQVRLCGGVRLMRLLVGPCVNLSCQCSDAWMQ